MTIFATHIAFHHFRRHPTTNEYILLLLFKGCHWRITTSTTDLIELSVSFLHHILAQLHYFVQASNVITKLFVKFQNIKVSLSRTRNRENVVRHIILQCMIIVVNFYQ